MLTRNQTMTSETLIDLYNSKKNTNEKQMNIVRLYYKSYNKQRLYSNEYYDDEIIITVCLTDKQLDKIKHKRIIVYKNEYYDDYDTAELLDYKKIDFDIYIKNKTNINKQHILSSIDDGLLDDVTVDMLLEDEEIEMSKILVNLKRSKLISIN